MWQGWTLQDWTIRHDMARVDIAGVDNARVVKYFHEFWGARGLPTPVSYAYGTLIFYYLLLFYIQHYLCCHFNKICVCVCVCVCVCIIIHGYSIRVCLGPYVIICNNFTVTFDTCLFESILRGCTKSMYSTTPSQLS